MFYSHEFLQQFSIFVAYATVLCKDRSTNFTAIRQAPKLEGLNSNKLWRGFLYCFVLKRRCKRWGTRANKLHLDGTWLLLEVAITLFPENTKWSFLVGDKGQIKYSWRSWQRSKNCCCYTECDHTRFIIMVPVCAHSLVIRRSFSYIRRQKAKT